MEKPQKIWTFYDAFRTTVVSAIDGEDWVVARAYLSDRDTFVKKKGRAIAIARLMGIMGRGSEEYRGGKGDGLIIFYRIRIEDIIEHPESQWAGPGPVSHEERKFFMKIILPGITGSVVS